MILHLRSQRKKDLLDFVKQELDTEKIEDITGFPIGTEGEYYNHPQRRMYLIGDAAGFAETLLGEGIYNAVISGKYLGYAIKNSNNPNSVYIKYNQFLHGMKKNWPYIIESKKSCIKNNE